jgi:hypothetical protein
MVYRYDSEGLYILIGDQPTNATSYMLVGGNEILPDMNLTIPLPEDYIPKASMVTRGGVKIGKGLAVRLDGSLDVSYDPNQLDLDTTTNQLRINMPVIKTQIATPAGDDILGTVNIIPGKGLNIDKTNGRIFIDLDLDTLKLSAVGTNRTVIYGDPHKASFTEHGVVKFQSNYLGYTSPIKVSNGVVEFGYDNVTLKVDSNGNLYVDRDEFTSTPPGGGGGSSFELYINGSSASLQKLNFERDYWNVTTLGDVEINPATNNNLGLIQLSKGLSANNNGETIVLVDNTTLSAKDNGVLCVNEIASVSSKFVGHIRRWDGFTNQYGTVTGVNTDGTTINTVNFDHTFTDGCGPVTISLMHSTLTDCVAVIRSIDKSNFKFVAKSATTTATVTAFWHAYGITQKLTG